MALLVNGHPATNDNRIPVTNSIYGEATSGTTTTVVNTALNIITDAFKDKLIKVVVGTVTFWRKITASTGTTITFDALVADVQATGVVKAASAPTDTLTVTAAANQGTSANALGILLTTAAEDTLAVSKTDSTSTINIALAKTTASKNAAATIQAAIRALSTVGGVSVAAYTCAAGGNWDTAAVATGETGRVAFTGGVDAVAASAGTEYEIML